MNYREDNLYYRLHKKAPATPMMAAGAITLILILYKEFTSISSIL